MATRYAAIDTGTISGAVYGIGHDGTEAVQDARRDSGCETACYRIVPITEAAAEYVLKHGGSPSRHLDVSVRGVTLTSEVIA
jgi:hypothetical protein